MNHLIYALCEVGGDPFYVGKTRRSIEVRFREHKRNSLTGTEAKYQKMRELRSRGIISEIILLAETASELPEEKFWVYTLIMDGYELTNMREGDAKSAAENSAMLEMKSRGERFKTASEFLSAMDREIAEAKARQANKKLIQKIRKELHKEIDISLTRFAGDFGKEPMSPALQDIRSRR